MLLSFKPFTRHAVLVVVRLYPVLRVTGRWLSPNKKKKSLSAFADLKPKHPLRPSLQTPTFWGSFSNTVCSCQTCPEANWWIQRSICWDQAGTHFIYSVKLGNFPTWKMWTHLSIDCSAKSCCHMTRWCMMCCAARHRIFHYAPFNAVFCMSP